MSNENEAFRRKRVLRGPGPGTMITIVFLWIFAVGLVSVGWRVEASVFFCTGIIIGHRFFIADMEHSMWLIERERENRPD